MRVVARRWTERERETESEKEEGWRCKVGRGWRGGSSGVEWSGVEPKERELKGKRERRTSNQQKKKKERDFKLGWMGGG